MTIQTLVDEVAAHLKCALLQSIPSDDQIILDHIRDSVQLLKEFKAEHKALWELQNARST